MKRSIPPGCIGLGLLISTLMLIPFCLTQIIFEAGNRLNLSPGTTVLVLFAIVFGSAMNIPVKRTRRSHEFSQVISRMHGMNRLFHPLVPEFEESVIAVNVGGCVVPCSVAFYELFLIGENGGAALTAAIGGVAITAAVCYALARPIEGVGITMPTLIPPLIAATTALGFSLLLTSPELAPEMAFTSGVFGTLIGADLLNLNKIDRINTGFASIGGAGTFDGIVLSGLIATLLA